MLLNPDLNPAQMQIQSFEPGRIQVNQQWHPHSLLIKADLLLPITAPSLATLQLSDFEAVFSWPIDIVLLGTGPTLHIPPHELLAHFYRRKIGIEFMDSYAASRTYSVLTSESRRVAAIILTD